MRITIYVPIHSAAPVLTDEDINTVQYESSEKLASQLATNGDSPAVILTAGITDTDQEIIAAAIRTHGIRVIEVREERWDGFSASPLSAACKGVIAGFGANGIGAAITALRASWTARRPARTGS